MTILYLTNHLNIGGISSYLLTLVKAMKKKGHSVYLASGKGELLESFKKDGAEYIAVPLDTKAEISLNVLASFFKLLKQVKEKKIDIIHANTRVTQVTGCLLSRYSSKPFVSTAHGFFKKRITRRIFPCWGERIIAISSQVKDSLINDFSLNESKIRVVHNGIDTEKFNPRFIGPNQQLRSSIGLKDGPIVGIVARLSDVKGHHYLIRAMKTVLESVPQAQLLIAGEGSIEKELKNLSEALKVSKSVFFIPNIQDTRVVLSVIDVFVLPSLKEGLGLSLMEAMACGVAVIGSNIGGIKTLIRDQQNGLLVEPQDIEGLSTAIIELLLNPAKKNMLADNAAKFIAENFSDEQMAEQTEKVYLECLNLKS